MVHMGNMVRRWLQGASVMCTKPKETGPRTGEGKCNRCAASFSPGDSNATAGTPNVTPNSDASAPPAEAVSTRFTIHAQPHQPSECPVIHMLAVGYIYVKLLYKFYPKKHS